MLVFSSEDFLFPSFISSPFWTFLSTRVFLFKPVLGLLLFLLCRAFPLFPGSVFPYDLPPIRVLSECLFFFMWSWLFHAAVSSRSIFFSGYISVCRFAFPVFTIFFGRWPCLHDFPSFSPSCYLSSRSLVLLVSVLPQTPPSPFFLFAVVIVSVLFPAKIVLFARTLVILITIFVLWLSPVLREVLLYFFSRLILTSA